jgi:hypothetical protein
MKITREDRTRPLVTLSSFTGGSGGDPGTGLVATGSNGGTEWAPIVRTISADGNAVIGPFVNFAAGSNITLTRDMPGAVASNTIRIHSTGGSGSLTVADEGSPLATSASTLDFVGAGVTATGAGATKTITIPGGGSGVTVEDEGTPLATDGTTLNFVGAGVTATGAGATKTITIPGGSSATPSTPVILASSQNGANTTSLGVTISAAASGRRLVVIVGSNARDVNTPTCTNVTFTEVLANTFGGTVWLSVYVGVVAGGASGTTVTITATGANFIFANVDTVADTLTPTAGTSVTTSGTDATTMAGTLIGPVTPTASTFLICAAFQAANTTPLQFFMNIPFASRFVRSTLASGAAPSIVYGLAYAASGESFGWTLAGNGASDYVAGIVAVT